MKLYDIVKRYPRLTAHIIAESLGYACPSTAGGIIKSYLEGRKNYCEWVYCCFKGNPKPVIERAWKNRHYHKGFMADYKLALAIVRKYIKTGQEPLFASWF